MSEINEMITNEMDIMFNYMLCSSLQKYNDELNIMILMSEIIKYNFHCSQTIFGRRVKYISLIIEIFRGIVHNHNKKCVQRQLLSTLFIS